MDDVRCPGVKPIRKSQTVGAWANILLGWAEEELKAQENEDRTKSGDKIA